MSKQTNVKNWKLIGKVKEAHGLKGELFVIVFAKQAEWAKKLKMIALASQELDQPKPYDVVRSKIHKEGLLITLTDIQDRTGAETILGQLVFIPGDLLISQKGEVIFLAEILGFQVAGVAGEILGEVVGFSSNGPQDLLVVNGSSGQAEIPFVEAFIVKLDFENKKIVMDLPAGLFDLAATKGRSS